MANWAVASLMLGLLFISVGLGLFIYSIYVMTGDSKIGGFSLTQIATLLTVIGLGTLLFGSSGCYTKSCNLNA